ncbi:hypothetical protein [Streptomyces sp. NBC_00859]|uniref:hypothetical protein n=1 Tax=Streptomyces sp. NBC_00859 TaxID=2903682 RepID=UPI00386AC9B0|nr:hypothetical protein OG584_33995 [Streptomyces sp. NBC_00859]
MKSQQIAPSRSVKIPRRRARQYAAASVTLAAAATLMACGASSDAADSKRPASASPSPTGAVTRAQADKIVDHYEEVNNRSNKTRDAKLLGTVEGGQVYELSKAEFKAFPTWPSKKRKEYGNPFTYKQRSFAMPANAGWFMFIGHMNGSKYPSLLVFDKVGGEWKAVRAVHLSVPVPAIDTSRGGLAAAVSTSAKSGVLSPAEVKNAWEDLYTSGGKHQGKELASSGWTKDALKTYRTRNDELGSQAQVSFFSKPAKSEKIYALRTKDGGVLTVSSLAHNEESITKAALRGSSSMQITPGPAEKVFNSTPRSAIVDEFQGQALVHLTPKDKPKVLYAVYSLVDSR